MSQTLELLPGSAGGPGDCSPHWGVGGVGVQRPPNPHQAGSTLNAHRGAGSLCFLSGLSEFLWIYLAMTVLVREFPSDGPGLVSKITPFKACRDF